MSFIARLKASIAKNRSCLCVGLDPDAGRMPKGLSGSAQDAGVWLRGIIDATADSACVYKPNLAFFLPWGLEGVGLLQEIIAYAGQHHPVILDGKFGDIGNTAGKYAEFAFKTMKADAVTVNPYLGLDSIEPFISSAERYAFLLGITSNPGSADIQKRPIAVDGSAPKPLYTELAVAMERAFPASNWGWVAGATQTSEMKLLRAASPSRWLLIPGVGEQGGALEEAIGSSLDCEGNIGGFINVSRSILYASKEMDYARAAGDAARGYAEAIRKAASGLL